MEMKTTMTRESWFQFFHACSEDQTSSVQPSTSDDHYLCIMDSGVLVFCDFFAAIVASYSLLLTMARVPEALRTFLLVAGIMVIAMLVVKDRFDVPSQILPVVLAGVVMAVSWVGL